MLHHLGRATAVFLCAATFVAAGCTVPYSPHDGESANLPTLWRAPIQHGSAQIVRESRFIKHIVVIVQENRTVDNLFNGFPGADTVNEGKNTNGQIVHLAPTLLTAPYDISHKHSAFLLDYDKGHLDGFSTEKERCFSKRRKCPWHGVAAYAYVPRSGVQPYWDLAQQYTFADRMFQTNQGPSFPAHQYIVSGTSAIDDSSELKASENPNDPHGHARVGGCDSVKAAVVLTIDPNGKEGKPVYPCFDRNSIMGLLDAKGISWRYYQEFLGTGLWNAVDALKPIWQSPYFQNVVWPSSRVLGDIQYGRLADVVFVTPSARESDHAGRTNGTGPSWVASIVNAIGKSQYWNSTAIFLTWDDSGGWFDHVPPTIYNSYEDGFRVPLVVISPYAKKGHVSHVRYEFGSILKFIEHTFGLPSLNQTDVRAHALSDCFDFRGNPRPFVRIQAKYSASYFEREPVDYDSPDDDQ